MCIFRERMKKKLLEAARTHGAESEPDHEIGDLQDMLIRALDYIPDDDIGSFFEEVIEMNDYFTIEMLE